MKVVIYIIVSFLVSFPCFSRWKKTHEDKIYTEYLEVDTVKKIDDTIFIWSLMDYIEPQKKTFKGLYLLTKRTPKKWKS